MIAAILNSGFEGTPISYSPRTDDVIALKEVSHAASERLCAASRTDKHF